ncbi:hypothetical protein [uncultured Winogradskyella sp.]|uniref:hypothetical protein n=1 Tax=uncultured Winogradskyella sp. TaxID=395353 RepID=UPI003515FA67
MKSQWQYILWIVLAVVTIYGLITGRYLFFVLFLPLGFSLFKKKDGDKGSED